MRAEADAPPAAASPPAPATVPVLRPGLIALAAIIGGQALWLWWAFSRGWYLQADLSNLAEGVGAPFNWHYISGELGGHFSPVARVVYWIFDRTSPLDYGPAVALRVACQAGSTWLLYRLLLRLTRNETIVLPVLAVYAFNPILLGGTAMFTPGITIGIGQVFALGALLTHAHREESGRLRYAVASGLLLAAAVLCSEQWALAALAFPLISLVRFYPGGLRARVVALLRRWRTWLLLVAPVGLAGVGVLAYAKPTGAATPGLDASYRLLRESWLDTIAPTAIGGPLHWYAGSSMYIAIASPSDTVVLLGQIGAVLIVLVGIQRNGWASLFGWLVPIAMWVSSMLLVGYRGFDQLNVLIAVTPRYLAAIVPFLAIGAVLALAPDGVARVPGGRRRAPTEPISPLSFRPRDRRGAALGVLISGVLIASLVSGAQFAHDFGRLPAHRYVDNLATSARLAGPSVNVYDTPVPSWLISNVEPVHRITDLLRLADVPVKVNDKSSSPLVPAPDGRLVKSVFIPAAFVKPTPPCGVAVHGAGTFTFPLTHATSKAEWYLHLRLFQHAPSTVRVELVNAAGDVATPVSGSELHLDQLEEISLRLPYFAPSAVRFHSTDPDTALCLTTVQVGAPFPVSGS